MDFLELIKRHWFLAGTMVAIFFAEIYPELGAKEGKINCLLLQSYVDLEDLDIRENVYVRVTSIYQNK
jgi:hypothetical protein